jgi:hypothetical protein
MFAHYNLPQKTSDILHEHLLIWLKYCKFYVHPKAAVLVFVLILVKGNLHNGVSFERRPITYHTKSSLAHIIEYYLLKDIEIY